MTDPARTRGDAREHVAAPTPVDHVVLAARTLEEGAAWAERTLGARPAFGGRHPQWGTHNAILSLGEGCYLELLAPDPDAPGPRAGVQAFGMERVLAGDGTPRPVAWMARVPAGGGALEAACGALRAAGVECGEIRDGARLRPDGTELRWRLAVPPRPVLGGAVPWPIAWDAAEHPSRAAPAGGRLSWLEVAHPEPARVRAALDAVGCTQVRVKHGPEPAIAAGVACGRGVVVVG